MKARLAVVAVLLASLFGGHASAQSADDSDLPVGHFYPQAAGNAGPGYGFRITNEGGIGMWDEFRRLGGVPALGYPISRRFQMDGFVVQATQKVVLQWRPDLSPPQASFVNVFDKMHDLGLDSKLQNSFQIPPPLDSGFDAGKSPEQVRADRLRLLDADPPIAQRYNPGDPNSIIFNGLPTSTVTNAGPFLVVRAQRTAIQHWITDNPAAGVQRGDVTVVNGGDIAKQLGLIPGSAALPETLAGQVQAPPATPTPVAAAPVTALGPAATPLPPFPWHWKDVTTPPMDCSPDPTLSAVQCLPVAGNIGTQYIKGRVMMANGDHVMFGVMVLVQWSQGNTQIQPAGDGTFTYVIGQGCPNFSETYTFQILDDTGRQASDTHAVTYTGNCNVAGEFHFDFVHR